MLRASEIRRLRCTNHPHRPGERACARCKTRFCPECFPSTTSDAVCQICADELAAIHAELHPSIQVRVDRAKDKLRNFIIGVAIIGVLAVPGYFVVRDLISTQITPEELVRFKYAIAGTFDTPEGVMVTSTILGGQVVSATSEAPPHEARRLIDEYFGEGFVGWRSASATFPQEIVVEAGQPARVEKLFFAQSPTEPPETFARDVEVLVSSTSATEGFRSIGRFTLAQTLEPQRFEIPGVDFKWVRLRVLSNYGSPDYVSLHEFDCYVLPRNTFGATPTPRS